MTEHVDVQLPALLTGELGRDETMEVAAHLRECPTCASELVGTAVAHGSLEAALRAEAELSLPAQGRPAPLRAEHSPFASQEDQPPLRLASATPHRHLRAVLAVAAAVIVLVAVGLGITLSSPAPAPVSAVAALQHMDAPSTASGVATVRSIGTTRTMVVTTAGLPAAPTNHYYEVWLLEPSTNKMLALGLLAPSGRGSFAVSGPIMAQFSAVDISLQANNGNPAHSKTSVLRGPVVAQRA